MIEYVEIENPRDVRRLNKILKTKLLKAMVYSETRIIGYPQGSSKSEVHFLSPDGDHVFYWRSRPSDDKKLEQNFFGHGKPGDKDSLNIDVQFNVSVVNFSRRSGGAFLRHIPTDSLVLAHRGIVTLGHSRIPKATLFNEMAATLRKAETSAGIADFLLIGELESPTLIGDIDEFSSELRRTVKAFKSNDKDSRKSHAHRKHLDKRAAKLREYFDEFSGQRHTGGGKKSVADCYHGKVVRAIRDGFDGSASALKSVAIDLTVLTSRRAFLFEAKTSADTQSIYTAIGQLAVHSPQVAARASGLPLVKVIVLPELPSKHLRGVIQDELGITLLTFTRSKQGHITVGGLRELQIVT